MHNTTANQINVSVINQKLAGREVEVLLTYLIFSEFEESMDQFARLSRDTLKSTPFHNVIHPHLTSNHFIIFSLPSHYFQDYGCNCLLDFSPDGAALKIATLCLP